MNRITAALQRRREAKAKSQRIAEAIFDLMVLDAELRGRMPQLDSTGRDLFGIQHQEAGR